MRFAAGIVAINCTAALALSYVAPAQGAGPDDYAEARKAFKEAYEHADRPEASGSDSALLKGYLLYPYLEAARIREALKTATGGSGRVDQRATDFILAYPQLPVTRSLRRAWLDNLAHREQWNLFLQVYRDTNDLTIRCESYTARIKLGKSTGLNNEIAATWLTPRSLPECETAFTWLKDQGLLTPDLVERRIRAALENGSPGFARQLLPQLPEERRAPFSLWAQLLESPAKGIDAVIAGSPVEPAALMAGWNKLGRIDADGARSRFAALVKARGLTRETASPYALALALALAWNRDSDALQYFEQVSPKGLDETAQEWRARAALWAQDWAVAQKSLAALSPSARQSARWRYWEGRVAEQLGDKARAEQLYSEVLDDDNYYAGMAAARLKKRVLPHPQTIPLQASIQTRLRQNPGMVRARELFMCGCGLRPEALSEWNQAYDGLATDEERQQAILLASSWGWYEQAVKVAATQRIFNDYEVLYPTPYEAEVTKAAEAAQLTPEMVYGVLRQESLYQVDAVSSADARGLMQLQLATAKRAARSTHLSVSSFDLFDPSVNTLLGAARLRQLLDLFDGQTPLALAGYNAGTNAVRRWLPQHPLDADIWIENIPYNETRSYVQRVLWHSLLFTWRRHQEAQPTDSWLERITPPRSPTEDRMANTAPPRT